MHQPLIIHYNTSLQIKGYIWHKKTFDEIFKVKKGNNSFKILRSKYDDNYLEYYASPVIVMHMSFDIINDSRIQDLLLLWGRRESEDQ